VPPRYSAVKNDPGGFQIQDDFTADIALVKVLKDEIAAGMTAILIAGP
jgi:hypothetical protein